MEPNICPISRFFVVADSFKFLLFQSFGSLLHLMTCLLHLVLQVSREQHERVKSSMKHAGNSIQPRSLNNVLGSFDTLNVQPFARFEEEESKKLHDYWLVITFCIYVQI